MLALLLAPVALTTPPYWFDRRIHNFGNTGWPGGVLHARVAPFATRLIDRLAYGGRDVRGEVLAEHTSVADVVIDLCCGTGTSTAACGGIGVDTSPEMLAVAQERTPDGTFVRGNAEDWGVTDSADVVTVMFALHEMPREGRRAVLANARRLATRQVVLCDIAPHYTPSKVMLSGEPYVLDYLAHIDEDVREAARHAAVHEAWRVGTVKTWVFDVKRGP